MSRPNRSPLPRNGHTLVVAIVARISGCSGQREVSLEDQVDHAKQEVRDLYGDGPVEHPVIMTKGKGERLDRPELAELEAAIRSRELDLIVAEDLGRIVRARRPPGSAGSPSTTTPASSPPTIASTRPTAPGKRTSSRRAATTSAPTITPRSGSSTRA